MLQRAAPGLTGVPAGFDGSLHKFVEISPHALEAGLEVVVVSAQHIGPVRLAGQPASDLRWVQRQRLFLDHPSDAACDDLLCGKPPADSERLRGAARIGECLAFVHRPDPVVHDVRLTPDEHGVRHERFVHHSVHIAELRLVSSSQRSA